MAEQPAENRGIAAVPANDHRPNSGQREGEISHAEVNESICLAPKTVIFGQQNRLRNGLLMEDEQLPRFHAGHDLVKFFYGGVRQIPDYLLDAILAAGISVTLVQERDLLIFHDSRRHQSCHVGRTRKTIYLPETFITSAFAKGYDYWAISEVIIQEAWVLLDYLSILELIRRAQVRLHEKSLLGYYFIKDTLRALARHRKEVDETEDNEFMHLYRRYVGDFHSWGRGIIERDPYEMTDEIFDEHIERVWADWKIDAITHVYEYPTYFQLDRDIVHPAAYELTEIRGLPLEPQTVEEVIHDIQDQARFRVGRQIKTDPLLDQLIDYGVPGIAGMVQAIAEERATGRHLITADFHDGYETVTVFKKKLQQHSSTLPEGLPGSVSNDFNELLGDRLLMVAQEQLRKFRTLHRADQEESLPILRELIVFLLGICRTDLDERQRDDMVSTPPDWTPGQKVDKWLGIADLIMPEDPGTQQDLLIRAILGKLDLHPDYHGLFLQQVRDLAGNDAISWGDDIRDQVARLHDLIPDQPYRLSSDPQALQTRLLKLRHLRSSAPDDPQQFELLAGIFIRLDRADDYDRFVGRIAAMGDPVEQTLRDLVESISHRDTNRTTIRQTAIRLLRGDASPSAPADSTPEHLLSRLTEEGMIRIFYHLIDAAPSAEQIEIDREIFARLREQGYSAEQIVQASRWTAENIPGARTFNMVRLCIAEALEED